MKGKLFSCMAAGVLGIGSAWAGMTYDEWAKVQHLTGTQADPKANPDGDRYNNALEYTFGTDPRKGDNPAEVSPYLDVNGDTARFTFRVSKNAGSSVTLRVLKSTNLKNWTPLSGEPETIGETPSQFVKSYAVPPNRETFYVLEARVHSVGAGDTVVTVGVNIGQGYWEGIPTIDSAQILQSPPNSGADGAPNTSKYPVAAGATQGSFTEQLKQDYETRGIRPPLRSWMGWFLWGNGTPPDGVNPGIFNTAAAYGDRTAATNWDYFNFQWPVSGGKEAGTWNPVRVDQQPLYLTPLFLSYNWAPGLFGYVSKPFKSFPVKPGESYGLFYWQEKQIVRGVNVGGTVPFLYQYGDKVTSSAIPETWRQAFVYLSMRPLETTVIVPGNLPPTQLVKAGDYNKQPDNSNDPFPYPVWDVTRPASDQTPFAIKTDRVGDFDADIVWEAANPRAGAYYDQKKYQRSAFNQPGIGNYMKMTVAQGSPFVWCEVNNSKYAIFYDLIRPNLPGSITSGNSTIMVGTAPKPVPGVQGVNYVLMYGDQTNPNQWYQESAPWYANLGGDPSKNDQSPGGFNPPPLKDYIANGGGKISTPGQHNFTYTAIFYRTDCVKRVDIGKFGANTGTDSQGNPYFYLEFDQSNAWNKTGKNWFVVASVPEMRYYHTGVTPDSQSARDAAATAWAETMGQYAFNFLTKSTINYSVTNMYQSTTNYNFSVQNPYVALGAPNAAKMTVPDMTVLALNPHQYQPITLGPDLTKASQPQVVWNPLSPGYGTDFPVPGSTIPNANKSTPTSPSLWNYWSLRGNLKTIVTKGFSTKYPFQNFLPVLPPPDYNREVTQTGIAGLNITNVGTGNTNLFTKPNVTLVPLSGHGSGATFNALVDKNTGEIQQIDVVDRGSGYDNTTGPGDVTGSMFKVEIDPPAGTGGEQATAFVQTGGGSVLAVFMLDKGSGYWPVFKVTQTDSTGALLPTDAPIISPNFDPTTGALLPGAAIATAGGAGFDLSRPLNLQFFGNGSAVTATPIQPTSLLDVNILPYVGDPGTFPSTGGAPTNVTVSIPPPSAGATPQTAVAHFIPKDYMPVLVNPGKYTAAPTASFKDDDNNDIPLNVQFTANPPPEGAPLSGISFTGAPAKITSPKDVVFTGGNASTQAVGRVYPTYKVESVSLNGTIVTGYDSSVQVSFEGGDFTDVSGVEIPEFNVNIPANGQITKSDISLKPGKAGKGLLYQCEFEVAGGRGFDAVLKPIVSPIVDTGGVKSGGEIIAVKVLRGGSNYLPEGKVFLAVSGAGTGSGAEFSVKITNGVITSVDVVKAGQLYPDSISVILNSKAPPYNPGEVPDPTFYYNPKGYPARFLVHVQDGSVTGWDVNPGPAGYTPMSYIPGSWNTSLVNSGPAFLRWWTSPFAAASPAGGYAANTSPAKTQVGQVLYSSAIAQFASTASVSLAPFGGKFLGGSAPDGYGLGGQLGGVSKFLGDIFNLQQTLGNNPNIQPSDYAINAASAPASSYSQAIFQRNNPYIALDNGLKGAVQGLQNAITKLFLNPPSINTPSLDSTNTWIEEYFSQYDTGVGRLVINPTATQPVWGVVSSVREPADIVPAENASKTGLSKWQKGMLWSGFGVSDQWNDQHYFYGYYLSSAALAGIFDQSWLPTISSKPATLWVSPTQMGTAIEQMLLTLAYDPDNQALNNVLYKNSNFQYQKFAFFDQWSGHAWATGAQPGSTSAVLDFDNDAKGFWGSFGTLSEKYRDENENSIYEGVQAWSAAILWGGATDRKEVVDQGIYLYSTSLAAADAYFLDKNYNLLKDPLNKYSWVPVTTLDSSQVVNNGGNSWPANTSYADANPRAFYEASKAFGDSNGNLASPGQSLLKKPENTLNNFFYAYPTGSKFIEAYPSTPWTMGIARNSNYMKKWAGSMMRQEWNDARNSALYEPGDWLGMAMASAMSGVLYNPGDIPFKMDGTPMPNAVKTYPERLWSNWVTGNQAPGAYFSPTPPFLQTSILSFFFSVERYGSPDWTYIARSTDKSGKDDNKAIVFTASFSKPGKTPNTIDTTFVAFNPGWTTRYANFQRLKSDGSIDPKPVQGSNPMAIAPKKMVSVTKTFTITK